MTTAASRSRRSGPAWALMGALLALAGSADALRAQSTDETRTTLDGVYTTEQAERGRETYIQVCAECHVLDWYTGDIVRAWEGAPLYNLFEVISTTMPQNNPGSLPRRQYVDMLAYILELNGMPPGDAELSTGTSRLRQILFQWSDGS
ncbi:MAG: cytochrome c [Longimicrobiales bacterium]